MDSIQTFISEAAESLGCGTVLPNNVSSIFGLARTCLQNAEDISKKRTAAFFQNKCLVDEPTEIKSSPPPVPPKPKSILCRPTPPPLPARPKAVKPGPPRPQIVEQGVWDSDDEDDDDDDEVEDPDDDDTIHREVKPRPHPYRRSSTSNIPAPVSPVSANPLTAVKSFLSLPGSIASNSSEGKKLTSEANSEDMMFLKGVVDPTCLVPAQITVGDSLAPTPAGSVPLIPQAPLLSIYKSLQVKLNELEKAKASKQSMTDIKSSLNRVRNIHMSATTVPTILQFPPMLIAYQLTLIDSAIFRHIPPGALLTHSPKTPHPAIVASTDFFNYLTRVIEHSILLQQDASGRAQHVHHWIKIACRCHQLKNYQTLKAIVSALGTPPIQRLKRTWAFVPKKTLVRMEELNQLMSETSNYGRYREALNDAGSDSTVPFLGIFIHDMTYLTALRKSQPNIASNAQQDPRVTELLKQFESLQQCSPYPAAMSPTCVKDINKNRRRKLSYALRSGSSMKRHLVFATTDDEIGEVSVDLQQCLVTQYLLTRSWVGEKVVDELSVLREPPKAVRSNSATDPVTGTATHPNSLRSSSGSLSSSSDSRPISIEDSTECVEAGQDDDEMKQDKKDGWSAFWLFGRKSMDHGMGRPIINTSSGAGPSLSAESPTSMMRSPRHFSFDEHVDDNVPRRERKFETVRERITMREGSFSSQGSLAASIFRKEFWRSNSISAQEGGSKPMQKSFSGLTDSHLLHPQYKSSPTLSGRSQTVRRRRSSSTSLPQIKPVAEPDFGRHTLSRSNVKQITPASFLDLSPHPLDPSPPPVSQRQSRSFDGSSKCDISLTYNKTR
ncbi:hypothetical protein EC973_001770 [Apophysomyces ossiformis]|uniref:Ras-GEF domain-containing protein n=1 Tax=Apophysomyces ossiformis TaxID=679940 RepID=A0A8H7EP38_9FUNG|nr:hypothetical protein EC973_001770 [Apophysomyces ossiformis]